MEQTGEYLIEARPGEVWSALNNAETLGNCINGVQSMEQVSEGVFKCVVALVDQEKADAKPLGTVFETGLSLRCLDLPGRHEISIKAKNNVEGGETGSVSGLAQVELSAAGAATQLSYSLQADLGGELAQRDPRMVDSTAQHFADDFFARFAAEIAHLSAPEVESGGGTLAGDAAAEVPYEPSQQWVIWAIMFGVLLLAVLLTF